MWARFGLGTLSNVIHTYPTQAEAIKQAADAYNRTRLTRSLKGFLPGGWPGRDSPFYSDE